MFEYDEYTGTISAKVWGSCDDVSWKTERRDGVCVPIETTQALAEATDAARDRMAEYVSGCRWAEDRNPGNLKSIPVDRIDIPGHRRIIKGIGFVDTESCDRVQSVAGPFYSLDSAVSYYEGRMAAIVRNNEELLKSAGLGQADGLIKLPKDVDLSYGSAASECLSKITSMVQRDALDNLCLLDLRASNGPDMTPGYKGLSCGCLSSLDPKGDGTILEPNFNLLMVPECDFRYMLSRGKGPFAPGGDVKPVCSFASPKLKREQTGSAMSRLSSMLADAAAQDDQHEIEDDGPEL